MLIQGHGRIVRLGIKLYLESKGKLSAVGLGFHLCPLL